MNGERDSGHGGKQPDNGSNKSGNTAADSNGSSSGVATPITAAAIPSLSRQFRMQYETAQQAWVLLYPEGMVKLNQSASEILQRCDGKRNVNAIVADLESAFEQTGLTDDVLAFMAIAREQHWITFDHPPLARQE